MAWERLAHVALSSSGDTLNSGTFTAKKNMKVILHLTSTGGNVLPSLRFNSDSGSNYSIRDSDSGGSDDTQTGQTEIRLSQGGHGGNDGTFNVNLDIINNLTGDEKTIIAHSVRMTATGASNIPNRYEIVGKWANSSTKITSIQVVNGGTGDLAIGSYITVLGAKETVTSDSITVSDLTAKKHLMIQAKTISDGQVTANYRFNADSGSNYARRQSSNGGSDGTGTSQNVILAGYGTSGETTFITTNVINEATKEKLVITELVTNGSGNGAGNAPNRREIVGKWANTSNAITSVTLFNNDTGSFAEGTEVTVYGTD